MLLAQGNFAAFMRSPKAFRAQALEQITGTGIYSRISQRVQQKYAQKTSELALLESRLQASTSLSKEDVEQKKAHRSELDLARSKASQELEAIEVLLKWADAVKALTDEEAAARAALEANSKVGLKMNLPKGNLSKVIASLPALRKPTVSQLSDPAWVAVETIVDEKVVREIVPTLKDNGAEGIVEYPLNKIIP